ncbi:TetR/AcrR family transcriptional regulator [Streptomyces afghaniensis]|uniref:TetR/AcrR family transcriptional regulator n=1 Tax=Streptomyces afghaniensis TaxID=66865 RepID=UPI0037D46050
MAQPGRRPAQQERSRITERKILAAARQALAEDGWEGLAVARVAAAAGVSVGSVYGRFTDKDGLVHAVQHDMLDEVDADLRDAFARLGERTDTPSAQLVADAVHALVEQVTRHGAVMGRLILRAAADPSLRERGKATGALAEELFTSLVLDRSDQLACPRPETAVPMAFRAVFSTAMWQVIFGPDAAGCRPITRHRQLQELIALCQAYLLGAGARIAAEEEGR